MQDVSVRAMDFYDNELEVGPFFWVFGGGPGMGVLFGPSGLKRQEKLPW